MMPRQDFCAIDFGTSNSAIAIPTGANNAMSLVELEPGFRTMPTAVFYNVEDDTRSFGRAAVAAYVDGYDGRLMRSIKSILGSDLIEQATEVGHGVMVKYIDVVTGYLKHLKRVADTQHGKPLTRIVIGRPVHFVDGDATRDAQAQDALRRAAVMAGFRDVGFQFEPIAAALDYESTITREEIVLVADIGGGTSDFSLVRVSPARHVKTNRQDDILANHGVHIAGTDFDQAVNLAAIMPELGFGSVGPQGRCVPGAVYFDLATWHLINTVYGHNRAIELREMVTMYSDKTRYQRLMNVIAKRLGHHLAAQAEMAKIDVATTGGAIISLEAIEDSLTGQFSEAQQSDALRDRIAKIVDAASETVQGAGVKAGDVSALYFTGGSTGLKFLTTEIAAKFPNAKQVSGDRFSSVAAGLGIEAQRRFA
jgi:hypothetical chaperone protein